MRGIPSRKRLQLSSAYCALCAASLFVGSAGALAQSGAENGSVESTDIIVTGSYLARANQAELASPTVVLGQDEIAKTGYTGVDDLLVLNTANVGSIGGVQDLAGGGADNHATRSANLRGLGPASTLVLLNGRRVASTEADPQGNNYVNLAALIPTIAVGRFETVLDGASALYGSDAIAGVMNIITQKRFQGIRLQGQYTDIKDAPGYNIQGMIGGAGERFSAMLAASFEFQDHLQNGDRKVTNFINSSGISQPGNFILNSRPQTATGGDVIIDNGVNGPINYSTLYDQLSASRGTNVIQFADPDCTVPGTGGIYVGPGAFPAGSCRFSYQAQNPIRPETNVLLVYGQAEYELSDAATVFLNTRYYHQTFKRYGIGSLPISTGSVTVPADNPFNVFGTDVTFAGRVLGINADPLVERGDVNGLHLVVGSEGKITDNWKYTVSGVYSRESYKYIQRDTDLISLQNALNGYGGANCRTNPDGTPAGGQVAGQGNCYYFSPFGQDQLSNDPAVYYNLLTDVFRGGYTEYLIGEAVVTGELFDLPAGPIGLALGAQYRHEKQATELDSGIINGRFGFFGRALPGIGSRNIKAVFAEVYLPVMDKLNVQAAVRYEDYGPFTTVDPKIGINFQPTDWLALRGSYSTAFRAPAISQANSNAVTTFVGQTIDPLDPTDTGTFRVINRVNNPDLDPESSKNFNLGTTLQPLRGLKVSVDYFNFKFKDQITLEAVQQVINRDPNGPAVVRDEFGRMIAVNVGYFNSGRTSTDGIDVRLDYAFNLGANKFNISNSATYINSYKVQVGPGQPTVDVVGSRNFNNPGYPTPRWRDNAALAWANGGHSANITMRYTDSVKDDIGTALGGSTPNKVKSWTVFDAQYAYRFGSNEQFELAVGAVNVFDKAPPTAIFTGYLPQLADALGRQLYARFDVKF